MKTKTCNVCKQTKSLDQFGDNKTKPDGKQGHCFICGRERNKQWYKKNRKAKIAKSGAQTKARAKRYGSIIDGIAANHGCCLCGEKDPIVLDFHHTRKDKDRSVSELTVAGYGVERIAKEIAKCVILCSNCHRRVHAGQKRVESSPKMGVDSVLVLLHGFEPCFDGGSIPPAPA